MQIKRQAEVMQPVVILRLSTCANARRLYYTEVSIADSFRFKGAAPEIINSRCAFCTLSCRLVLVYLWLESASV